MAVCLLAFDRPAYFSRVVRSILRQSARAGVRVYCFLDGAVNGFSGRRCGRTEDIGRCARVFTRSFPDGELHASPENLGIALNYDRAETYLYERCGYEFVLFLEDDLVLQPHYFANIKAMIAQFGRNPRIGAFSAYGDHDASLEEQLANRHAVRPMGHLWAYCAANDRWRERQRKYRAYLEYIEKRDYILRSHRWIWSRLYPAWGAQPVATSQDAAKSIAMLRAGQVKISTYTNNARYIGKFGTHTTPEVFARNGYVGRAKRVFGDAEDRFRCPERRLDEIEAALRAWYLRAPDRRDRHVEVTARRARRAEGRAPRVFGPRRVASFS